MSSLAIADPQVTSARSRYRVAVDRGWEAARHGYEAAARTGAATPFGHPLVVGSWYRAMAERPDVEPLLVSVADAATGVAALHLPLVRRREGRTRVIAFADLDLVDYNAPVLGPAAPRSGAEAASLWGALRRALPAADLLTLRKMPPEIGGRPNPLALLRTLPCDLNGNVVRVGEDYAAHMRGTLRRVVRKEFERSWRVFSRHPEARFETVTGLEARARVLAAIEHQQPIRMGLVGKAYALDADGAADFYRRLVDGDPEGRTVTLLALKAGEEIVAALLGLRTPATFTMIRISSSADPAWTTCSPGRLVIERTMAHLHAEGVRTFDFSVGNYDYKRRFGVEPTPLVDLVRPLTARGLPGFARARARAWLHAHPSAEARVRRWLGRPPAGGSAP